MSRTGDALRKKREEKGITQKELAEKTGISRSTIAMVESDNEDKNGNRRYLNTDDLYCCAKVLGVSPCYLLTGNDDDNRMCAADELGFSNETISELRMMDEATIKAIELLITDPTFSMEWAAYLFSGDQGLWQKGQKLASENEYITLGNYGDYGGGYKVGDLITYAREMDLLRTMREIKRGAKK